MVDPESSPWYQEIFNKGVKQGLEEARQERRLRQNLLCAIEFGLDLKFGFPGLELIEEISQIQDVDVLRAIRQGILTVDNLDELREIYRFSEA